MLIQRIEGRPRLIEPRIPGEYQLLHTPRALLHCDYTRSVIQPVYTDAASVTDRGVAAPDSVISFDQASGDFLDGVGSVDLALTGSWLRQQVALGNYNGLDHVSRLCTELTNANDNARAAAAATYDLTNTGVLALCVEFRHPVGGSGAIVGKQMAGAVGWRLVAVSNGRIELRVSDGTTTLTTLLTANHADGAPHRVVMKIDMDGFSNLSSDIDPGGVGIDTSVLNSISTAALFGVGLQAGVFGGRVGMQIIDVMVWKTNAAAIVPATVVTQLQPHGNDPGRTKLTTKTHGPWSDSLGTDSAGALLGTFSEDVHLPIGMGAEQLGLHADVAVTNYCPDSDDGSAWTQTASTRTADPIDGPRKFRESNRITQTGAGGRDEIEVTGLVAATEYTMLVALQTATAQSVDLAVYDAANTAQLATSTESVTALWDWYSFQFTVAAGETSVWLRIYGGLAADTAKVSNWMHANVHLGAVALRHVPTAGGSATSAKSNYRVLATAAGELSRGEQGEIAAVWSQDHNSTLGYLMDIRLGVSLINAHLVDILPTRKVRNSVYDSAAVAQVTATSADMVDTTVEQSTRARWSATKQMATGNNSDLISNGVLAAGDINGWVATETTTGFHIGQDAGANNQLRGHLHSLIIYDRPRKQVL